MRFHCKRSRQDCALPLIVGFTRFRVLEINGQHVWERQGLAIGLQVFVFVLGVRIGIGDWYYVGPKSEHRTFDSRGAAGDGAAVNDRRADQVV